MPFKIDENLPPLLAARLRAAGHDALTVADQSLSGSQDDKLAAHCRDEGRVLVTLDLGFSDVRTHPPGTGPGIVVLRLDRQDRVDFEQAAGLLVSALENNDVAGAPWIVEHDRVRVREVGIE